MHLVLEGHRWRMVVPVALKPSQLSDAAEDKSRNSYDRMNVYYTCRCVTP